MFHLKNGIRSYHWGSTNAITQLLGRDCEVTPQAELWLGAHPSNPSQLLSTGQGLDTLIETDPVKYLGSAVNNRFGQLPFLMKVLAAQQPLSIQVHPSLAQAQEGFSREDREGISRDAAHRNYKDANHKPEMLYALGDFVALSGFREPAQILEDLQLLEAHLSGSAAETCAALMSLLREEQQPLDLALRMILCGGDPLADLTRQLTTLIAQHPVLSTHRQLREVAWAAGFYPADPGVLVALLMNVVTLRAGEAISLGAGNIHAYLRGLGIEVMANSDNVLRGGLTSKHIDVPELLAVTRTVPGRPEHLVAEVLGTGNTVFTPTFDEFQLQVLELDPDQPATAQTLNCHGGAIALCTAGSFILSCTDQNLEIQRGESVFLPAGTSYRAQLNGAEHGTLFVASAQDPQA